MHTIKDALNAVKELFALPLGYFPRGGVERSLNVKISTSPNMVILTSRHGLVVNLRLSEEGWSVVHLGEEIYCSSLEEAIYQMISPIVKDEIKRNL